MRMRAKSLGVRRLDAALEEGKGATGRRRQAAALQGSSRILMHSSGHTSMTSSLRMTCPVSFFPQPAREHRKLGLALGNDKSNVIVLFPRAEVADVTHNRCQQVLWR